MATSNNSAIRQGSISSQAAIHAKPTVQQWVPVDPKTRASAVSSCGLLQWFARELFCEKIQVTSERMPLGLGFDSELALSRLVTLCCPSDSGPVALARSTGESDCFCLVSMPTPTAQAWKGGTTKEHPKANRATMFAHWWARTYGLPYPSIEVIEAAQGFPATWSELPESVMQSAQPSPSGSPSES